MQIGGASKNATNEISGNYRARFKALAKNSMPRMDAVTQLNASLEQRRTNARLTPDCVSPRATSRTPDVDMFRFIALSFIIRRYPRIRVSPSHYRKRGTALSRGRFRLRLSRQNSPVFENLHPAPIPGTADMVKHSIQHAGREAAVDYSKYLAECFGRAPFLP